MRFVGGRASQSGCRHGWTVTMPQWRPGAGVWAGWETECGSRHLARTSVTRSSWGVSTLHLSRWSATRTRWDSKAVVAAVRASRGRRREPQHLGDDGVGGAQHRGDQRGQVEVALAGGAYDAGQHLLGCARQTGGGWPVRVRRKEGVTNHLHPESCAGRREAAGEALTGARMGRAIEHRKRACLERRDCPSGRRPHRHHRDG